MRQQPEPPGPLLGGFGIRREKLVARLARVTLRELEPRLLPPPGCGTCRGWTGVLLVGDDGPHRPDSCPVCGRTVPGRLVRVYGGVNLGRI